MKSCARAIGIVFIFFVLFFAFISCGPKAPGEQEEQKVIELALTEAVTKIDCEFSGLAWYKDYLIILPQYPARFGGDNYGKLLAIPKAHILSYLDGIKTNREKPSQPPPLVPMGIDLVDPTGMLEKIQGYEGFEAIGFWGDRVFMTIEANPQPMMLGHLVSGDITTAPDNRMTITLGEKMSDIPVQADLPNSTYETLLVTKDQLIVIYEGNGIGANAHPQARIYDHDLEFKHAVPFPNVEFRITDATDMDSHNRFWCINYIWPDGRERYRPATDTIAETYGKGKTHAQCGIVERLLEFEYTEAGIVLVKRPPIQFQLEDYNNNGQLETKDSRNWEGIVRLESDRYNGFLVTTDEFPRTILGFVASARTSI